MTTQVTYHNALPRKFCQRKQTWKDLPDRTIYLNIPDMQLPNNSIHTNKYSILTFFPLNLYKQFNQLANIYFLIIGILQLIPQISFSGGSPVIFFPLTLIVLVSMIKDLVEDFGRWKADNEENNKKIIQVTAEGEKLVLWQSLHVGNIIKVKENEFFPADCVIIKSSDKKGLNFIETKNLDGETNLKHKNVHKELKNDFDDISKMSSINLKLDYEKPNPFLYEFKGSILNSQNNICILDNSNFILRGCSLKNTEWVYVVVAYSGHDTKIMLNSIKAKPKSSSLEKTMNSQILFVFIFQLVLCMLCAFISILYFYHQKESLNYLMYQHDEIELNNIVLVFIIRFGNWLLLFTNFVPISLMVTLEMVKVMQGARISHDDLMIAKNNHDIKPEVHSSNLNEELGKINYIFSDKTGTLTCNYMEFKNLCVDGISYGDNNNMTDEEFKNLPEVTNVNFRDREIFNILANLNDPRHNAIHDCFMHLVLCHTVLAEKKTDDLVYNASSPDELALVNFARICGYEFHGLDDENNMIIKARGIIQKFKLILILEFNSTRKRMSVIVEDQSGQIILLCKGADTIIWNLLATKDSPYLKSTQSNLEKYALVGLRTLVLAKKVLDKNDFEVWKKKYTQSSLIMDSTREEMLMKDMEELETGVELVGATANLDKLQDEVGETIHILKKAGIKVWVLTGDKVETAINIGFSCKLLTNDLYEIRVEGKNKETVLDELKTGLNLVNDEKLQKEKFSLIVTGESLIVVSENKLQKNLMQVAQRCQAVMACRVSPKQKQEVVAMVRNEFPEVSTLAIGDGANDVNMITAAHIGVGIRGVEGQQAARSSDYAIGEFKNLRRLLLVHGTECYRRNAVLILYNFYKNMLLVFPQFWAGFISAFTGVIIYDNTLYQSFNMFFAAAPIICFAVYDEEISEEILYKNPDYYGKGLEHNRFYTFKMARWILRGLVTGFVMVAIAYGGMAQNFPTIDGEDISFLNAGNIVFTACVIVVNYKIFIISYTQNIMLDILVYGSIVFYLIFYMILNYFYFLEISNTFWSNLEVINFYLCLLLIMFVASFLDTAFYRQLEYSKISTKKYKDIALEKAKSEKSMEMSKIKKSEHQSLFNRTYTGFAFSQEEEFSKEVQTKFEFQAIQHVGHAS